MAIVLTILIILVILLANEWWWRKHEVHNEVSRKFVHVTVGSFVAAWPFFLSWQEIRLLSMAFVASVLISRYLGLFKAIHSVQRPTWGEVFFAMAVGLVTLITSDSWIYAIALLQMSLADGLAAIIGSHFGGRYRYSVFGSAKTVLGTLTFFVVSLAIMVGLREHVPASLSLASLASLSLAAGLIENLGIKGSDNLFVPILVALVLTGA